MPMSFRLKRDKRGTLVSEVTGIEVPTEKPERKPAEPMLWRNRLANYRRQNGCKRLTPAQQKRLEKKKRHRAAKSRRRKRP